MRLDGHAARRRFSQNFLHDPRQIARIVGAIDPRPGQAIVEIGPGLGALTEPLLRRAGHLVVIELDRDLAQRLRERFDPAELTVIEADALAVDWPAVAKEAVERNGAGDGSLRIVGNLPYHISTPLLFALMPIAAQVADQHVMLQKEVVDRMVAAPGTAAYGRLSVMLQMRYRIERLFDIGAGAFTPAPKVQSSVARLVPRPVAELPVVDAGVFARIVAAAFSQRRKTLRNALSAILDAEGIRAAGIDPAVRGETLGVDAYVRLAREAAARSAPAG
ncbi:MAG TPA: 16S rRNA (adenine(1518)-N(6)/adenine(1519)-N(6))-dimethyltransferase RsmA [Burkholderiaceae bacterium]|nr:16S rRNA (adenine(1518)-N(6)/adenine(1519)-N(6))-dimethyltransferase RsmA [Burkholderiaceae bacterium]